MESLTLTKDSIYELINAPTQVMKQHFVEYFTGDGLDTFRWYRRDVAQSNTGALSCNNCNGSNEGYRFVNGDTGSYSWQNLDFNNVRQFNPDGSVIFGVLASRFPDGYNGGGRGGISLCLSNSTDTGETHSACLKNDSGEGANILAMCKDSSSTSSASTGIPRILDGTFFVGKIELGASSYKYGVNGVLKATISTDLPSEKMQPKIMSISRATGEQIYNYIRYCEAWKT